MENFKDYAKKILLRRFLKLLKSKPHNRRAGRVYRQTMKHNKIPAFFKEAILNSGNPSKLRGIALKQDLRHLMSEPYSLSDLPPLMKQRIDSRLNSQPLKWFILDDEESIIGRNYRMFETPKIRGDTGLHVPPGPSVIITQGA